MTHAQRNAALLTKIRDYTIANTVSKRAAQEALVREGFYLKNGQAAPEFAPAKKEQKVKA